MPANREGTRLSAILLSEAEPSGYHLSTVERVDLSFTFNPRRNDDLRVQRARNSMYIVVVALCSIPAARNAN